MLEWCFKYYKGECPDWKMHYTYHYPPLLEDLKMFIPVFNKELVIMKPPQPVLPIVQLIYVLPKESIGLLPREIQEKLKLKLKLDEWYDDDPELSWAFCKYLWECHIHLPEIQIEEIEELIEMK